MTTPVAIGGGTVPAVGQGTWHMGERSTARPAEVTALRQGLDLGMTLIDTAEMYGDGGAEVVVAEAIAGRRDEVYLVSKVYPHNAGQAGVKVACERSLARLGTDRLDLYLLHWRGGIPLSETVEALDSLRREGKILNWGVSNLDAADMREQWQQPWGSNCVTDQVLYHAGSRGVEYELLPWCRRQQIPVMAYCPLAQGGRFRRDLLTNPIIAEIATERGASAAQVALAWVIRSGDVIAIPKAVRPQHVRENAAADELALTSGELVAIDEAFPPPTHPEPLDIV